MGASDRTTTARLLRELNTLKGLKYPELGYAYFADVTGSGVYSPRVYVVTNASGGVSLSHELNGATARKRCDKIRAAIAAHKESV